MALLCREPDSLMPRGFSAACSLDPLLQCSLHAGGSHAQGAAHGCCFGNVSFPFLGPEAFPSVRAPGGPRGLGSSRSDSLMPGSRCCASVRTLHARNTLYSPCHNPVMEHKLWRPIARMVVHVPPSSLACSLDLNFILPSLFTPSFISKAVLGVEPLLVPVSPGRRISPGRGQLVLEPQQ